MSGRARVLVVDDEPQILRALAANLKARDYDVDVAATGEDALVRAADHPPDLVVLDLGLPGISGIEVIEGLRGWSQVPILVLSAREQERSKIEALDAGADDYVTKPFGMGELLARVRAALRRDLRTPEAAVLATPDFTVDLAAKRVTREASGRGRSESSSRGGPSVPTPAEEIRLTPIEWGLVEALVRNAGKLVSQRALLQQVWGPEYGTETGYLRVHMAHIRRKLEPDPSRPQYFLTEPGMGYRFVAAGHDGGSDAE